MIWYALVFNALVWGCLVAGGALGDLDDYVDDLGAAPVAMAAMLLSPILTAVSLVLAPFVLVEGGVRAVRRALGWLSR